MYKTAIWLNNYPGCRCVHYIIFNDTANWKDEGMLNNDNDYADFK